MMSQCFMQLIERYGAEKQCLAITVLIQTQNHAREPVLRAEVSSPSRYCTLITT